MSKLSTKESQELERAVDMITEWCNRGYHPNDAIIKTATDMQLTPDRLPVLVNLYNLGATASRWENGSTLNSKVASFPIADIDAIVQKMYPKIKEASPAPHKEELWHMTPIQAYGYDPLECYNNLYSQPNVKSASVQSVLPPAKETLPKIDRKIRETVNTIKEEYSGKKAIAEHRFHNAVAKFANLLCHPECPSIKEARDELEYVYGELGVKIADYISNTYPKVHREKVYQVDPHLKSNDHPFYVGFENIKSALEAATIANQEYDEAMKKCAAALKPLEEDRKRLYYPTELDEIIHTPPPTPTLQPIDLDSLEKKAYVPGPTEVGYQPPKRFSKLETLLNPEWQGATEREYSILDALNDPAHKAKMRKIKIETMLVDLINTDPFLRQQDPEAVLDAYNDIVEMAPDMATKKIWVRNALRQYMATESLDFNTLGQISQQNAAEADKKTQTKRDQLAASSEYNRGVQHELDQLTEQARIDAAQAAREAEIRNQQAVRARELLQDRAFRQATQSAEQTFRANEAHKQQKHQRDMAQKQYDNSVQLEGVRRQSAEQLENLRKTYAPDITYNSAIAKAQADEALAKASAPSFL